MRLESKWKVRNKGIGVNEDEEMNRSNQSTDFLIDSLIVTYFLSFPVVGSLRLELEGLTSKVVIDKVRVVYFNIN